MYINYVLILGGGSGKTVIFHYRERGGHKNINTPQIDHILGGGQIPPPHEQWNQTLYPKIIIIMIIFAKIVPHPMPPIVSIHTK